RRARPAPAPTAPLPETAPEATPESLAWVERRKRVRDEILGIALLLGAAFVGGALLAGGAVEGQSCTHTSSVFGPVGSCLRGGLLATFGAFGAALVPLVPAVHALNLLGRLRADADRRWLVFTIGLTLIVPVATALATTLANGATINPSRLDPLAGFLGSFVAYYLTRTIGLGGAWVAVAIAVSVLTAATLAWNPIRLLLGEGSANVHGAPVRPRDAESLAAIGGALAPADPLPSPRVTTAESVEPRAAEMPALDMSLCDGATAGGEPDA